jgi:hypothetical protein
MPIESTCLPRRPSSRYTSCSHPHTRSPRKLAFSIICHVIYLQNFSNIWPVISLISQSFIVSCVLVVADHFFWFFHFSHLTHQAHHTARQAYRGGPIVKLPAFRDMTMFFAVCIWLTLLFLFLSLSANDNTLPHR